MALKSIKALALASLAAGPAAAAYDCSTSKAGCTPLDDYVNAPDSTYKWEDLNITLDGPGWTAYVVNMTSQSWLTSADWDFAPRDDGSRAGASPVCRAAPRARRSTRRRGELRCCTVVIVRVRY